MTFGELQSTYIVSLGTTKPTPLLDVLTALFLETKLDLSLQIFDLHLPIDLHDPLPRNLLRLIALVGCEEILPRRTKQL